MASEKDISYVRDIMLAFADRTGLTNPDNPARRYLWTDAHAVCTYLSLHVATGNNDYLELALALVDQVHSILGRHRDDDARVGWISGLSEEEGREHPTAGGLRIGKSLNERQRTDPVDERLEWERDGQYFHYLTKWMHALCRVAAVTGEAVYRRWAVELAEAAYAGFAVTAPGGKRLCWKMSIDLSYPLVASAGHHDPLDGYVTFAEIAGTGASQLDEEVAELANMIADRDWATTDPLGIGGLLFDASRVIRLTAAGSMDGSHTRQVKALPRIRVIRRWDCRRNTGSRFASSGCASACMPRPGPSRSSRSTGPSSSRDWLMSLRTSGNTRRLPVRSKPSGVSPRARGRTRGRNTRTSTRSRLQPACCPTSSCARSPTRPSSTQDILR